MGQTWGTDFVAPRACHFDCYIIYIDHSFLLLLSIILSHTHRHIVFVLSMQCICSSRDDRFDRYLGHLGQIHLSHHFPECGKQ